MNEEIEVTSPQIHVLITISDQDLCAYIMKWLIEGGFYIHSTVALQDAQRILEEFPIGCVVMTDTEAISLDHPHMGILQYLPKTMPTFVLIKPSKEFPLIFDQVRIPPYFIHECLTLPVGKGEVIDIVTRITGSHP
jgi:hypothetical protein